MQCVADAYLNVGGGYYPDRNPCALILNDGEPVLLGASGISLLLRQTYEIVPNKISGEWKISTRSYVYSLADDSGEVIAFHWHPFPDWEVDFPHLHFRRTAEYSRAHYPTGRVAVEEVVALVIREFGVAPRRDDYLRILDEGLAKFRQWRTWA